MHSLSHHGTMSENCEALRRWQQGRRYAGKDDSHWGSAYDRQAEMLSYVLDSKNQVLDETIRDEVASARQAAYVRLYQRQWTGPIGASSELSDTYRTFKRTASPAERPGPARTLSAAVTPIRRDSVVRWASTTSRSAPSSNSDRQESARRSYRALKQTSLFSRTDSWAISPRFRASSSRSRLCPPSPVSSPTRERSATSNFGEASTTTLRFEIPGAPELESGLRAESPTREGEAVENARRCVSFAIDCHSLAESAETASLANCSDDSSGLRSKAQGKAEQPSTPVSTSSRKVWRQTSCSRTNTWTAASTDLLSIRRGLQREESVASGNLLEAIHLNTQQSKGATGALLSLVLHKRSRGHPLSPILIGMVFFIILMCGIAGLLVYVSNAPPT